MAIDHDQIFKTLFKTFFKEFMELFLPQQAKAIDFSRITFLEQEIFTDVKGGRRKHLDLVVEAGLRRGGQQHVLFHTECQAKKDSGFPERMYGYHCQLFVRHRKLIVPIAVFSDEAIWRRPVPDTYTMRLAGSTYVSFHYHLIKLKHLDYRKFLNSNNPLAFALMAKMKYNKSQRVRLKADFLRLILGTGIDPARKSLLVDFVETYMRLDKREEVEFKALVTRKPENRRIAKMITTYERRALQKGRREGLLKGIQKGLAQGKQADLLLLLEKKFGKLRPTVKGRIRRIQSAERLDSLLLAVLDAQSLEQLEL